MAERKVNIGLATFLRPGLPVWGFGMLGETVDVDDSDVERFDRLNGAAAAPVVPLPEVAPVNEPVKPEPPRSGRGSSVEAWIEYAENLGLTVDEGATRDEVIALVDDSK